MPVALTPVTPDRSVSAVPRGRASDGEPLDFAGALQAAFARSRQAIKWWWDVKITPLPGRARHAAVRLDLTADDAAMLARVLDEAQLAPGLDGPWLSTAEAAQQLHVTQSTIRGWLASGKPKGHPFPAPDERRNRLAAALTPT